MEPYQYFMMYGLLGGLETSAMPDASLRTLCAHSAVLGAAAAVNEGGNRGSHVRWLGLMQRRRSPCRPSPYHLRRLLPGSAVPELLSDLSLQAPTTLRGTRVCTNSNYPWPPLLTTFSNSQRDSVGRGTRGSLPGPLKCTPLPHVGTSGRLLSLRRVMIRKGLRVRLTPSASFLDELPCSH